MKMRYVRWAALVVIFVAISVGLVLNTNLGTLSSFGWQAIAAICPLGALESMLASRTIFPRALIVFVAIVVIVVLFGKFFCAWVCPVAPIRSLRDALGKRLGKMRKSAKGEDVGPDAEAEGAGPGAGEAALAIEAAESLAADESAPSCDSGCSTCAVGCAPKRSKLDSRHIILGGSLLSAALFGFPVFCLICPIGLIFGTVIVAWQFIGFDDLSLSLLIYPLLLAVELLLFRKWCARLCPMGAMLSLVGLTNRFFKPVVDRKKCIRARGGACTICSDACKEGIDPHYHEGMNECSKCGLCKDACPTGAITFAVFPKRDAYEPVLAKGEGSEGGRTKFTE